MNVDEVDIDLDKLPNRIARKLYHFSNAAFVKENGTDRVEARSV
jgi:hypothetical protein